MYTSYSNLQRKQLSKQAYTDTQSTYLLVYAPGRHKALQAALQRPLRPRRPPRLPLRLRQPKHPLPRLPLRRACRRRRNPMTPLPNSRLAPRSSR